jgi:hypothetical protein
MRFVVLTDVSFKSVVITNASTTFVKERDDYFSRVGVGNLPNGVTKGRIAGYDEKDENIATLIYYNEYFQHRESYSQNRF